ncbi:phosphatase PAP2 family protein [Candidatus Uhrbacteria bacterium]|nr:phosphatase PAP2 family protein [Candidatus Uhrbacteria bacterium]
MTKDAKISRALFDATRISKWKIYTAVFCASYLLWLMIGIAFGLLFPNIKPLVPVLLFPLGISLLISELLRRARPFHPEGYKPLIHLLVETPSFPSSHSTVAFALFVVFLHFPLVWPVMLVAAIFVSFGRVAVGVHYFSDVIVGAILGIVLAFAMRIAISSF